MKTFFTCPWLKGSSLGSVAGAAKVVSWALAVFAWSAGMYRDRRTAGRGRKPHTRGITSRVTQCFWLLLSSENTPVMQRQQKASVASLHWKTETGHSFAGPSLNAEAKTIGNHKFPSQQHLKTGTRQHGAQFRLGKQVMICKSSVNHAKFTTNEVN